MIRTTALCLLLTLPAAAAGPRLDYALGVLARKRGETEEARRRFESARAADPTAFPLVEIAIRQCLSTGDRAGAVKLYRDIAAARPENLSIQLVYADFLDAEGKGDSIARKLSDEALQAALARYPGHPEIIRRLFDHASGNRQRQEELLALLGKEDPASSMLYTRLSRTLFDADDAEARKRVDEHLQLSFQANPGSAELARSASDHFRNSGRPAEAISILEEHVRAAPSSLDMRVRLGILYFAAKRDEEGERALKEVLDINPNEGLAHQSLAKFYRLREQPEPARIHAGEALKIRGGSASEFLKLGNEWLDAGNPREARLLLEKAVFVHPDNRDLAEKLAIATRRDPETRDQAARLFREAEAAKPVDGKTDPAFLVESASALIDEGQGKAAEERLRNAIRAYPAESKKETAAALRQLAALWEKENRNLDAARSLRQRADTLDR